MRLLSEQGKVSIVSGDDVKGEVTLNVKDVTWEEALDKIARALKDDRDANLIQKNEAGVTVNRWTTTGFLAASATTNETAWLTYKTVRAMGIVGFDNQARV